MSDADNGKNGTDAPNQGAPATEKTELELAQEEAGKWKNDFLYLKAEFENYKRHAIKERSDLLKFGTERVSRDILEVVDNFERALQTKLTPETIQTYKVGIEMTAKELKEVLGKHGVTEVPSEGQAFNPAHHEAISSEPTKAVPAGFVARVFKKPYKLHDKIIRMGQVIVATDPTSDSN
ncbi:MAG: nucleotide exchange factor GrpE [Bdellovibrionaceae bacterium]|nr:nucleotide exchange factor GrpE [Pseudobdellovibrionaceae bacterium]